MTAIIIQPCLWRRRYEVSLEPPLSTHNLRSFAMVDEAREYAHRLAIETDRTVVDRCDASDAG